jgi:hypothetical protein
VAPEEDAVLSGMQAIVENKNVRSTNLPIERKMDGNPREI